MLFTGNPGISLRNIPIRWRITLWYTLFLSILLTFLSGGLYYFSESFLVRDAKNQLSAAMEDVEGDYLRKNEFSAFHEGVYFALYDVNQHLIVGRVLFFTEEEGFFDGEINDAITDTGSFMYLDRYLEEREQWIRGALSVDRKELYKKSFLERMALLLPVTLLFILLGGFFILTHALAPLEEMKKTVSDIEKSMDLTRRIENSSGRDEINRLAAAFNDMLQRVEDSYRREKQFAADVSHELRTPLSVILAQCEYALCYGEEEKEEREALDTIFRQGRQMKNLVENLLQLSGLEDKKGIERKPLDASLFCREYLMDVESLFYEKGIRLRQEIEKDIWLLVQEDLFRTMLSNLVSNALKFAAARVTVSLKKEKEMILLSVWDDGAGFAPEEKDRIWDRLYQVDTARNKKGESGTGLGLSFVKQIAMLHGASVKAESEKGRFALFQIFFPSSSLHLDPLQSET